MNNFPESSLIYLFEKIQFLNISWHQNDNSISSNPKFVGKDNNSAYHLIHYLYE